MKILVTGTAGFIGFHLALRLVKEGHDVTGLDSINDYYDVNLKYGRLAVAGIAKDKIAYNTEVQSTASSHYSFYQMQLEDAKAMDGLFAARQFDVVVNLAAQAGVRYSVENPHAYINSNIVGFLNILECSKKYGVKHLLYASSSSVYGLNSESVFSAPNPADHPVSLYAASKRSNELMAHVYANMYNLPVTGLRFFTVYGPWGRPDMALYLFTRAIVAGKPINVFNHGNMRRDFTYVDDIIEGIARMIAAPPPARKVLAEGEKMDPSTSTAPYRVYNIGNNSPVKLLDFIEIIEKELGKPAIKNMMDIQPGDVASTYADVSPLMTDFNYKPGTTLAWGVKQFIDWYKEFYKA